jgi:hypothetical protein
MSATTVPASGPHGHRSLRLATVVGVVLLLAVLGTYSATEMFGPSRNPSPGVGENRTVVVYDNTTVFQNTTHNVTTPVYHNTTVWQNSTVYQNGSYYHTTTVYVNTTKVVMIPVVNITGISWALDPSGAFAGEISAALVTPTGPEFNHSYPLGTVMWIVVTITNNATRGGQLEISVSSPFELVDSQPSVPHAIEASSTMTVELSIGVPYSPGDYSLAMTVAVT